MFIKANLKREVKVKWLGATTSILTYQVVIKAMIGGQVRLVFPHTKVPLANHARSVADRLQPLSNSSLIQRQSYRK